MYSSRRKTILVNNSLIYTSKFIMVLFIFLNVCAFIMVVFIFLNIYASVDFIFEKYIKTSFNKVILVSVRHSFTNVIKYYE